MGAVNTDEMNMPDPTRLCIFSQPKTTAEWFERTARYAKDPKAYLEGVLGSETFESRKNLLCIPEEVDRDIYGTGNHKTHFQQHIATLLGKESGLFFVTGVQAQLAALKVHCDRQNNSRVAWHLTSHLESAEERAFDSLYRLDRSFLGSNKDENPTVDEIKEVLFRSQKERPAAIVVELPNRTLGCKTYTFDELHEISTVCNFKDVQFHLDGARLWEIGPYYQQTAGKSFADIAALFDSVYVSFYKGLRGAAGAMLLGDEEFIEEAKVWQRRAGGNVVTLMYEVIDCERGYNENTGSFQRKWEKMSEIVNQVTSATKRFKTQDGKQIVNFMTVPATCCQVRTVLEGYTTEQLTSARDGVEEKMNVRVFERIRPKQTVDEMTRAERVVIAEATGNNVKGPEDGCKHELEWMIAADSEKIETKVFVDAYVALCEELLKMV